jgi:hypothetical protein
MSDAYYSAKICDILNNGFTGTIDQLKQIGHLQHETIDCINTYNRTCVEMAKQLETIAKVFLENYKKIEDKKLVKLKKKN